MTSKRDRDSSAAERCAASLRRRDFLKLGLAGASAGVVALPALRRAYAMLRPDAPAKRVLVLFCSGGMRSSTAFHASANRARYNPWGVIDGTNTPFSLGKVLDDFLPAGSPGGRSESPLADAAYALDAMGEWQGSRVARLREVGPRMSVVGSWNTQRGDHYRSNLEEPTGSSTGSEPGLLTRIGAGLAANMVESGVPAFHIEPNASFGLTTDELVRYIPVPMFGTASLPGQSALSDAETARIGHDWAEGPGMRARLDNRRVATRAGFGLTVAETLRGDRAARVRVGQQLQAPWISIEDNAMASQGSVMLDSGTSVPLSNAMMLELFERALGPDPMGDGTTALRNAGSSGFYRNAIDVALAVRLLQLGSPATVVEMGGFDTHSGEMQDAPDRFRFVGRLWATLNWLLSRIPEPGEPGKSMLDRTLVFTMSEFGRDPGSDSTGFNNGEGSDHGNDPSCYYFAHAIMGGGVVPGRHIGPASADSYSPATADRIPPRRLLASVLWSLGLDSTDPDWGFPDAMPLSQLWTP